MDQGRRFIQRTLVLIAVTFMLGAMLTPPDPLTQIYYAVGAIPISFVAAYVLVYRTDQQDGFGRFLAVSVVVGTLIWFVGSVVAPAGVGIGGGLVALVAALVCAYAVVYQDRRAALASEPD